MDPVKTQLREANDLIRRIRQECPHCGQDSAREGLALDIEAYCLEHGLTGPDGEEHTP